MRKFYLLFFLFILNLSLYSQSGFVKLDTNVILIGQQTKLSIEFEQIKQPFTFPLINSSVLNGLEIISSTNIDTTINEDGLLNLRQDHLVTAWDSGVYLIPALAINDLVKTEALLLNVLTVEIDQKNDIKDIKKPLKPEFDLLDILPWVIGLILILIFYFLYKKFANSEKEELPKIKITKTIPAHITALENLTKTEKKELWQKNKVKEYHSEISEIIRKYIEARFNCLALEATTQEILEEVKNRISNENYIVLSNILSIADLAKFAKSKPNDNENVESMASAKKFVNQTKLEEENE